MNREEYQKWRTIVAAVLRTMYAETEVWTVLEWFDGIKGSEELDLLGQENFDAMMKFSLIGSEEGVWTVRNTMYARVFMYAPLILKQAKEEAKAKNPPCPGVYAVTWQWVNENGKPMNGSEEFFNYWNGERWSGGNYDLWTTTLIGERGSNPVSDGWKLVCWREVTEQEKERNQINGS